MIIVGEGWEHWTIGEVWERWTIWEGVGTLDYRVCFTSGPRLCELHQAADGLLHNDNDRGEVGMLDYRVGEGWERWTGGVGTLDYRVGEGWERWTIG